MDIRNLRGVLATMRTRLKNGSHILQFDVLKRIEILKIKTPNLFAQGIIKYLARLTGPSSAICVYNNATLNISKHAAL